MSKYNPAVCWHQHDHSESYCQALVLVIPCQCNKISYAIINEYSSKSMSLCAWVSVRSPVGKMNWTRGKFSAVFEEAVWLFLSEERLFHSTLASSLVLELHMPSTSSMLWQNTLRLEDKKIKKCHFSNVFKPLPWKYAVFRRSVEVSGTVSGSRRLLESPLKTFKWSRH